MNIIKLQSGTSKLHAVGFVQQRRFNSIFNSPFQLIIQRVQKFTKLIASNFDYIRQTSNYSTAPTTTNTPTTSMFDCLPLYVCGEIVRGFQRGSKELGIPTANYAKEVVKCLPESLRIGVYYGWANVNNGDVYKMVMSVGWNPYYVNKEKSMETHILHNFNKDLYGDRLKVCILGYLRPETNFKSLDDLITAIRTDIADAEMLLDSDDCKKYKNCEFFTDSTSMTIAYCGTQKYSQLSKDNGTKTEP